jgi:hypothetical protein
MYYDPYQWGMGGMMQDVGHQGMQGGYIPYMMGQNPMMGGMMSQQGAQGMSIGSTNGEAGLLPLDSAKMRQSRMGHYGYAEGRGG